MAYEFKKHRGIAAVFVLIASVIAAILVLHIIFVLLNSNSSNTIVSTVGNWSWHLAAWFRGLFSTGSSRWNTVLDYGLAALAYLFVGRLIAEFIERA
jgi:hypothetical protein